PPHLVSTLLPYTTLFRSWSDSPASPEPFQPRPSRSSVRELRRCPRLGLPPAPRRPPRSSAGRHLAALAAGSPRNKPAVPTARSQDRKSTRLNSSHQIISY